MATTAQILANRRNAQVSTGPSTPAGKLASSRNATSHGLSAGFTILAHESLADFENLRDSYLSEFHPETEHDNFLLDQMVQARWKLQRLQKLEEAAFEAILSDDAETLTTPEARIVAKLGPNALDKIERYTATAQRAYYKAHNELQKSQTQKKQIEAKALETCLDDLLGTPKTPPVQNKPNFTPPPTSKAACTRQLGLASMSSAVPEIAALHGPGGSHRPAPGAPRARPDESHNSDHRG